MNASLAVLLLCLVMTAAASADEKFRFTREQFDAMDERMEEARRPEEMKGGGIAWGEGYVLRAYVEMFRATGDREYLRRFVTLADQCLAVRDDALGIADHAGEVLPLWGIAGKYTVATATLRDTEGRDAVLLRSIRYAYNDQTRVTVEQGAAPGTYRLGHRNEFWEEHNRGNQTFEDLSLDPDAPRYFERVINHPDQVADLDFTRDSEEAPSYLLVALDLRKDTEDKSLAPVKGVPLVAPRIAYRRYIGPICSPMVLFASIVQQEDALGDEFGEAADRYVRATEESLATWESCWRDGPGEGQGYYLLAAKGEPFWCDGVGAPLNYLGGVGQVLVHLYDCTGKPEYMERATRLARLYKGELRLQDEGFYVWEYWWGHGRDGWTKADDLSVNTPAYPGGHYAEDMSHAAWEVEFAVLAYRHGWVFDRTDMARLAATFTRSLHDSETGELATRVNGNGDGSPAYSIAGGRWVDLAEFDPEVFEIMRRLFGKHDYARGAYGHLAVCYALLYRWQETHGPQR